MSKSGHSTYTEVTWMNSSDSQKMNMRIIEVKQEHGGAET